MVDYLNQKSRSYIIGLHLINDQNESESKSFFQKKPKADTFLPTFNLSFCLSGIIKAYALSIKLFGPNKKIMLSVNVPILLVQELAPAFCNKQYSFLIFLLRLKKKSKQSQEYGCA